MRFPQSMRFLWRAACLLACLLGALAPVRPALAHPHVWADVTVDVPLTEDKQVKAITVKWLFDETYSAFSVEDKDENGDKKVTEAELAPMLNDALTELADWRYFTDVRRDGRKIGFAAPTDGRSFLEKGRLVFQFTLPLAEAVPADGLEVRTYDPTYYMAMEAEKTGLRLVPARGCTVAAKDGPGLEETMLLSRPSEDAFTQDVEPGSEGIGIVFATVFKVSCP